MVNWGVAVPIIVAIIGIIGTSILVPFFNNIFSPQSVNKPQLHIGISPGPSARATELSLMNSGAAPATNLSIMVTANNTVINNIVNLLSTANVTLVNPRPHVLLEINHPVPIPNQSFLELHIKRFAGGEASLVSLAINGGVAKGNGEEVTPGNVTAYVNYDQGSIIATEAIEGVSSTGLEASTIYLLVLILALGLFGEIVVLAYIMKVLYRGLKRRFVSNIIEQMTEVRTKLKQNLTYNSVFPFTQSIDTHIFFSF
jgi:hypothetical protein